MTAETAIAVSRKKRLRALEDEICSGLEEFYYTGMKLKEIKDDQLYKEDGFETWEVYCKVRWEWSNSYVARLITSSEYREKLPSPSSNLPNGQEKLLEWSERSVRELTRLENKKDAARVAAKVLKAVEQSAKEVAKDPKAKRLILSAATVRKFVDADLGVDRAAKAKETRRKNEEPEETEIGPEEKGFAYPSKVRELLIDATDSMNFVAEMLKNAGDDEWTPFSESNPGVVKRLTEACESLVGQLGRLSK
jgi:hypothetical protein